MNKWLAIVLAVGLLVIGFWWSQKEQTTQTPILEGQISNMGAVEVAVTPDLESGEGMRFKLTLNTHSVELDYDFAAISRVTDDLGKEYMVKEWSGGKGGHHLEGELMAEPLQKKAKRIMLKLTGIDGQDKEFEWDMEGGD